MSREIFSAVKTGGLIAAHRGARSIAPENTMAAARTALAAGAGMMEADVRMSRDGKLVVIHDPHLARTSDGPVKFPGRNPWLVHEFTLEELKLLDFGSWFATADPASPHRELIGARLAFKPGTSGQFAGNRPKSS